MNIPESTHCIANGCADSDCEKIIINTLLKLGVPANTKGFHYIKSAVQMGVQNPIGLTSMSKTIYPAISELYRNAAPSCIERAMRYAINQSCLRGDSAFICSLFGYTGTIKDYNPTNREFIAVVSEYIKQCRTGSGDSQIAC